MRTLIVLVFSALGTLTSTPTGSCHADAVRWDSPGVIKAATFGVLQERIDKMIVCGDAGDTDRAYTNAAVHMEIEQGIRLSHYLLRHAEAKQFIREDTKGAL